MEAENNERHEIPTIQLHVSTWRCVGFEIIHIIGENTQEICSDLIKAHHSMINHCNNNIEDNINDDASDAFIYLSQALKND